MAYFANAFGGGTGGGAFGGLGSGLGGSGTLDPQTLALLQRGPVIPTATKATTDVTAPTFGTAPQPASTDALAALLKNPAMLDQLRLLGNRLGGIGGSGSLFGNWGGGATGSAGSNILSNLYSGSSTVP